MEDDKRKLSDYIDRLNAEQKPDEHETDNEHLNELYETVRKVRSLKEPAMPKADFEKKLTRSIAKKRRQKRNQRKVWMTSVAGLVAALLIAISIGFNNNDNIARAMQEAYREINAYCGELEIVAINADGDSTVQTEIKVWADRNGRYYSKGTSGAQKDIITVNNGEIKWQIRPDQQKVYLFPAFPDAYRFALELGHEIEQVSNALETKVIGEESVSGRTATVVEVLPDGGDPYRVWIDNDTKLPIQKETTTRYALKYRIAFTDIETIDEIPHELLAYNAPEGYQEIRRNAELALSDLNQAIETIDFAPKIPTNIPSGYALENIALIPDQKALKLDYANSANNQTVTIIQKPASGDFRLDSRATLGKVDDQPAEILAPIMESDAIAIGIGPYAGTTNLNAIRWQKDEIEYAAIGNVEFDLLAVFIQNMVDGEVIIPARESEKKGQIEVPVDLTAEENDQKNADAGHSVYKLDPLFASQVFVSLKMSPEGIAGEYPIRLKDLKVVENTGELAIVEVSGDAPIRRVYLERIIRKDASGIWTVVGYDPAD